MRPRSILPVLMAIGLLLADGVSAQQLEVNVSADTVTVGERFRISFAARHDFAAPATFPIPAAGDSLTFGDIEVLRLVGHGSRLSDAARIDSVTYEVTTFALDSARIAPAPVLFTAGEDTFFVMTEEAFVPVARLVPEDAEEIRDIAPLIDFPRSVLRYALLAAALLLVAALIAFLVWRRRRQTGAEAPDEPTEPDVPPAEEAMRRLRELEMMDLSGRDAIRTYYIELSDVLRTYVWRRLGIHALEQTTRELVDELRARPVPDEETTSRIRNVLVQSDYVKFADAEPPAEESRRLLGVTRSVIDTIERKAHPELEEDTTVVMAEGHESVASDESSWRPPQPERGQPGS